MTLLSSAINKMGNAMHLELHVGIGTLECATVYLERKRKTSTAVAKPRKGITPLSVRSPVYADAVTGQSQICIGV